MKAITIHQPWARLIAKGIKRYETRSWRTNHRGLLAIHASTNRRALESFITIRRSRKGDVYSYAIPFDGMFTIDAATMWAHLHHGHISAIAYLHSCEPAEHVRTQLQRVFRNEDLSDAVRLRADAELSLGNFEDGRWCWRLEILFPVFAKAGGVVQGRQGLWNLPVKAEFDIRACAAAKDIYLDKLAEAAACREATT